MDKRIIKDINRMENTIIKEIYEKYIKIKHPEITLEIFKKTIYQPIRLKGKTQIQIIEDENIELDNDTALNRCHFIILDKNKMRRCKCTSIDDDIYCHLHFNKTNILSHEYMNMKQKYET